MKKNSLLAFLKEHQKLDDYWYDCLRYELDKHIYYYGDHFKRPLSKVQKSVTEKSKYNIKLLLSSFKRNSAKIETSKTIIISNAYFNFNNCLAINNYTVIQPPWTNDRKHWKYYNSNLIKLCLKIKKQFEFADFSFLISNEFLQQLKEFSFRFREYITEHNIKALIVPNDESFFENISIKIFRELLRPSFTFLHGFTAQFNGIDDYRSDYLIVWGKRSKELYIDHGMAQEKIFISGHPSYQKPVRNPLQFSLTQVLVLTKAVTGTPHSTGVSLYDRGNLITYLLSIQRVLKRNNVANVRLRIHPSENINWYMKFLDNNFFIPDTENLTDSLSKTSLVVGPISSMFIDAVYREKNYLVFEPTNDNISITNSVIYPPFDGSDIRIPVANSEDELFRFIQEKKCADIDLLQDYLHTPFDVSFIKTLL